MTDPGYRRDPAYLAARSYIADCTMALHCNGRRVSPWVPYSDGAVELPWPPERKSDIWVNELRFTDPDTHEVRLIVRIPGVRIRREEPERRRVDVEQHFGSEIESVMLEYAGRLAEEFPQRARAGRL